MTTLRDQAIRLVTEDKTTDRRGAAHRVRAVAPRKSNAMPTYQVRRRRSRRRPRSRTRLEAPSEDVLRNQLLLRNLEVKQVKQKKSFNELELSPQRVPKQEIMHFSRQMAAFVRTGIPITDALEVVEDGSGNKRFRQIARRRCASRSTTACRSRRRSPSTRRSSRRTTSASCSRPSSPVSSTSSLEQLSGYIERDLDAKSKIKAAMIYPLVIFGMSILTVVILAVCVMPKFVDVLQEPRREAAAADACC